MEDMEEEIAFEALSIVEHALSLIQSGFFDDAIEIMRQAIGLYEQIDREAEINALKNKIADIYIMKEQAFKKEESKEILDMPPESMKDISPKDSVELYANISKLLENAKRLINSNQFDEALDNFDEAIVISQQLNDEPKVEEINKYIEDCYNKKAQFLREKRKQEEVKVERQLTPEELKVKKLREFEEAKEREERISNEAFDKIGKASDFAKIHQYDEAIALYLEGISLFDQIGWSNESKKIQDTVSYIEKQKEKHLQEIERVKAQEKQRAILEQQKAKELMEVAEIKQERITKTKAEEIPQIKAKRQEDLLFQNNISRMIDEAEKLARQYDIDMKKAIKKGELIEECIYPEVIEIYEEVRKRVNEKGWKDQVVIYSSQIEKYKELLERDNKIREIEQEKARKQKEFEDLLRVQKPDLVDASQATQIPEVKRKWGEEKAQIKEQIEFLANKADQMAREYETQFKKAIKKGDLSLESKYPNIINIYSKIIAMANEKGLSEEIAIYSTHITKYRDLLERENKVKEIEKRKLEEKKTFEDFQKIKKIDETKGEIIEKVYQAQVKAEKEEREIDLEHEIDDLVSKAERMAREYEVGIKKGNFDLECPYKQIIEIYDQVKSKVYAIGWQGEAEVYKNQIKIYQEKLQNDIKLRELEEEKQKKQLLYEEAMKASQKDESGKYIALKMKEEEQSQTDIIFNQAMDLINKTENEVKSYELSLKKDILTISSPYEKAIKNYENARKLLLQIGWKDEALKLNDTISLYKQKKARDDNLREIETEKLKKEPVTVQKLRETVKKEIFGEEEKRIEFQKLKQEKAKEADFVFKLINRAEKMAQEYEIKKKDDILSVKSPYQEIINTYKVAQEKFKEIGWTEQASQLVNTINYYKEKMDADERLRYLEHKRIREEQAEMEKMQIESKLAKEAEEELKKQKAKALEIKKKQQLEYEAKKDQAFNFMDLAKKELTQNNFDKAINFYKESEKIFAEINWSEGIKMINESVGIIKRKREKYEQEQRYLKEREEERKKLESEIKQQISKAQDLKKMQEEQRRQEFLELQKEKEREKEIADQAYKLLEEGTKLKNKKKFEEAYEKYIMGRDLFNKLDWQHEVSRINNDLLFILKKEMKQAEKIKAIQEKKEEEQKELEVLLKEADLKQQELERIKKEEKRKQREKIIEEEMENANFIIKDLKYNEAILKFKRVIRKLEKIGNEKLIKQIKNKIDILENASQIPLIAIEDIEKSEYRNQYKFAFRALDKAQLSISKNLFMRAISELSEAIYNLEETKLGDKYIPLLEEKINTFKKELGIEESIEPEKKEPVVKTSEDDLRAKIAARRAERRKKIRELMEE
jgi:uncharacterized protein YozE (UPF0346 family)